MAWYSENSIKKVMQERFDEKKDWKPCKISKKDVDLKYNNPVSCRYWFIEVKGYSKGWSESAQRRNYLLMIFGQICNRMIQKNGYYGICLPDYKDYYRKEMRDNFKIARRRLKLYCFLITKKNRVLVLPPCGTEFKAF